MFHLQLPASTEAVRQAHAERVATGRLALALRIRTNPDPRRSSCEVTIGESALALTPEQVAETVAELIDRAQQIDRAP